jgi:hypothetical protein
MHEGAKSTVNFCQLLTETRRQISSPVLPDTESRSDLINLISYLQIGLHACSCTSQQNSLVRRAVYSHSNATCYSKVIISLHSFQNRFFHLLFHLLPILHSIPKCTCISSCSYVSYTIYEYFLVAVTSSLYFLL